MLYYRVPRLFAALSLARGDGRYGRLLRQIAEVNLLILDDWGPDAASLWADARAIYTENLSLVEVEAMARARG